MKVLIRVTRRTQYASIVEMKEEMYKRICDTLDADSGDSEVAEELNAMIDTADWQDDELISLDEFELAEDQ